jgi:hemoglobin/transferrin/lactoferrin receptor protein
MMLCLAAVALLLAWPAAPTAAKAPEAPSARDDKVREDPERSDESGGTRDERTPGEVSTFMETVTITAKTFESPLVENPKAITIVEDEEIAQTAPANVGSLLNGMPGLAAAYDSAWGFNPTLRGLNKERIIVMSDGIRVNASQPYGALASFADVNEYERVEVVKGPASFPYGCGAMGGVVNLIPRRFAFTDDQQVQGRLSFGGSNIDDGYRGSSLVAFTGGRHAIDLALSGAKHDDYEVANGTKQQTGYEQWSGTVRYRAKLSAGHSLGLGFQRHQVDDVWYPGSMRDHPSPAVGQVTVRSPEQDRTLYYASYEGNLGGAKPSRVEAKIYHQKVDRTVFGFSSLLGKDIVRGYAPFTTNGGTVKYDLFLGASHTLTVGAEYWRTEGSPERYQDTPPPSDNAVRVDPFQNGSLRSGGVFAQDDVALGKWTLNIGLRLDRVTGDADQAGFGPDARTTELKHSDNAPGWSLGAVHRLSPSVNPYVNVSQGFRAAGMRERFENALRPDGFFHIGNPQLEPERNLTAEIGMRGTHRNLDYSVSVYNSWIDNYIAGRITGETHEQSGFPIKLTENLAEVDIWGVELQLDHGWSNALHAYLLGSLQYGHDEYHDEPQFQMPPPEATLGLTYRPGAKWNTDIHWRIVARQDRVAVEFSSGLETPTPSFSTVNVRSGYHFANGLAIHFGVRNLLNEDYYEHLAQGVGGVPVLAPGMGIYAALSLAF